MKAGQLVDASQWANKDRLVRLGYLEPLNIVTADEIAEQEAADLAAADAAQASAPESDNAPAEEMVEIDVEIVEEPTLEDEVATTPPTPVEIPAELVDAPAVEADSLIPDEIAEQAATKPEPAAKKNKTGRGRK
jgi:hypothetical protein